MKTIATALLLVTLTTGCAVGHITAKGEVYGFAVGHAEVKHCAEQGCDTIKGGALSTTFTELLSTVATLVAAYFTAGG